MMHSSPTILAFDTTGIQDSISLYHKGAITSKVLPQGGSQLQSAILIPSLVELLQAQNLIFRDVSVLAALSGPGSFTGIRIGLATAQGLLIAGGYKPVIPTLLELLAFAWQEAWKQKFQMNLQILSVVDSKRGDYFCQSFQTDLTPVEQAHTLTLTELQAMADTMPMVSDKAIAGLPNIYVPTDLIAEVLVQFCLKKALSDSSQRYQTLAPFYIRNPEFKKQKRFMLPHS